MNVANSILICRNKPWAQGLQVATAVVALLAAACGPGPDEKAPESFALAGAGASPVSAPPAASIAEGPNASASVPSAASQSEKAAVPLAGVVTNLGPALGHVDLGALGSFGLGGAGMVEATASVRVSTLTGAGLLTPLTNLAVGAGASFEATLELEAGVDALIVQAIGLDGSVLGSALVAVDALAGIAAGATITAETSLEVAILLTGIAIDHAPAVMAPPGCGPTDTAGGPPGDHPEPGDDMTPEDTPDEEMDEEAPPLPNDCGVCSPKGPSKLILAAPALDILTHVDARVVLALAAAVDAGLDLNIAVKALAQGVLLGVDASAELLAELDIAVDAGHVSSVSWGALVEALASLDLAVAAGADLGLSTGAVASAGVSAHAGLQLAVTKAFVAHGHVAPHIAVQLVAIKNLALSGLLSGLVDLNAAANASATLELSKSVALHGAIDHLLLAVAKAGASLEATVAIDLVAGLMASANASPASVQAILDLAASHSARIELVADAAALVQARADLIAGLSFGSGIWLGFGGLTPAPVVGGMSEAILGFGAGLQFDASLMAELFGAKLVSVSADLCANLRVELRAAGLVDALVGIFVDYEKDLQATLTSSKHIGASGSAAVAAELDLVAELHAVLGCLALAHP